MTAELKKSNMGTVSYSNDNMKLIKIWIVAVLSLGFITSCTSFEG